MGKKSPKITFLLSLLIILTSCSKIEPTYQRKNIQESIKKICKEEYNLEVSVEEVEDTLWIYSPFDRLIVTDQAKFDDKIAEKIGNIILSLQRVILSIDKPPKFYVFAASDTEKKGADYFVAGFVADIVKFQMLFISRQEYFERQFVNFIENPRALGDKEGLHIEKFNLDLPNFIALLTQQKIINKFSSEDLSGYFEIEKCAVTYNSSVKDFNIEIDIKQTDYKPGLPSPFKESLKIFYDYISRIYAFNDFSYVRIADMDWVKIKTFNRKALEEEIRLY